MILGYVTRYSSEQRILGGRRPFGRRRPSLLTLRSVVGLGWATAKAVIERFVPLWLSAARSLEFDWSHVTVGLEANLNIVRRTARVLSFAP